MERGGIKQALARSKYDPSDIIAKLAFWLIFLVALQIAFGVFGPNPISDLQGLIAYLPNVLVAIVIIVVAAAIAKAATCCPTCSPASPAARSWPRGPGSRCWSLGPSPPWTSCRSPPDRDRPVVRDLGHRGRLGRGRHRRRRDQDHAALLGAATPGRGARSQLAQQATSDEGNGAAVYADTGTRSSRPSGPAGHAGTARPSRRRDASTGHRAGASRPPTNQPSHTTERKLHATKHRHRQSWQGRTMVDPAGDKLGTIDAIYLDDETGQPVGPGHTGLFTAKTTFVPLAQAQDTGDSVQVPYDKQQVIDAPTMEADGQLSQDEEAELYRHYGLDYSEHRSDSGLPAGTPTTATLLAGTPRGRPPTTP